MSGTQATDGAVIAGSVDDAEAFVAIFERHFHEIHRYLARRVGGELADDLAAEAFAEAFRVRARYRPLTPDARPWLYGIAANLLYKHRRSEARRLRALARTLAEAAHDDADGALDRVAAAALAPRVAAALRGLSARDREVVLLFAWAELGYAEIAAALAIPIGTVRSRLSRARAQVQRELGDDDSAALPGVAEPVEGAARA
jgi:RNA polymerase sigma factor (sigma-70 family)